MRTEGERLKTEDKARGWLRWGSFVGWIGGGTIDKFAKVAGRVRVLGFGSRLAPRGRQEAWRGDFLASMAAS